MFQAFRKMSRDKLNYQMNYWAIQLFVGQQRHIVARQFCFVAKSVLTCHDACRKLLMMQCISVQIVALTVLEAKFAHEIILIILLQ